MEKQIIRLHEGIVSDVMPAKIVDLCDGKGGFVYNYGAEEVTEEITEGEGDDATTKTVTKYRHSSLVMTAPKTQNHILEVLLGEKYPIDREQKLFNDYIAAKEKVLESSAKNGYLTFLADRKAIKEMVETDCSEYGIPNE